MLEGWGPHLRRSPPQSGGLSLPSTSFPWPASCVLSTLIRRNRGWGGGSGQKWQAPSLPLEEVAVPNEHSDLGQPGRGGGWPSQCLALLPTPLAGPSGAHVALWEHFPAFFFFFFFFQLLLAQTPGCCSHMEFCRRLLFRRCGISMFLTSSSPV